MYLLLSATPVFQQPWLRLRRTFCLLVLRLGKPQDLAEDPEARAVLKKQD